MHNKQKGFTLIELMVVIALIALLASVILASVRTAGAKGRDAARRENLSAVKLALELNFNDSNSFPAGNEVDWAILSGPLSSFLPSGVPADPVDAWPEPLYKSTGSVYSIYMQYESGASCKTGGSGVDPAWFGATVPFCEQ
jgi:general secretion pathway protein G